MHFLKNMMMKQSGTAYSKPSEVASPKEGSLMCRKGTTTT